MFLVCGEALMDVFSAGDTATGMTLDARIGGSPFNVALALARLAQPVAFFGAVSTGFLGERLMAALAAEGIATQAVVRTAAPTTLSLVGLDAQGVPAYDFYGQGTADRQVQLPDLARLPAPLRAVHLGSYATVVEPIATTLRELVKSARGTTLIAYDPNVRLNVEPELQRWQAQLEWMLPRCDLLKISDEDLARLRPGQSAEDFAASALARGTVAVAVTRGAQGASVWSGRLAVSVPGVPVRVVDTVGAGDTFQAALLAWLGEHDALQASALAAQGPAQWAAALGFAARAASITCSRRGADVPRRSELD